MKFFSSWILVGLLAGPVFSSEKIECAGAGKPGDGSPASLAWAQYENKFARDQRAFLGAVYKGKDLEQACKIDAERVAQFRIPASDCFSLHTSFVAQSGSDWLEVGMVLQDRTNAFLFFPHARAAKDTRLCLHWMRDSLQAAHVPLTYEQESKLAGAFFPEVVELHKKAETNPQDRALWAQLGEAALNAEKAISARTEAWRAILTPEQLRVIDPSYAYLEKQKKMDEVRGKMGNSSSSFQNGRLDFSFAPALFKDVLATLNLELENDYGRKAVLPECPPALLARNVGGKISARNATEALQQLARLAGAAYDVKTNKMQ